MAERLKILRRGVAVDGHRRHVPRMAHHGVEEGILAREEPRQREVDDRLGDDLAELVVHEGDERLFLEGRHAGRVARTRRRNRHRIHVDAFPRTVEELRASGFDAERVRNDWRPSRVT